MGGFGLGFRVSICIGWFSLGFGFSLGFSLGKQASKQATKQASKLTLLVTKCVHNIKEDLV